MSWISDVHEEIQRLKKTPKELKKFGLIVGSVFLVLAFAGYFKQWPRFLCGSFFGVGVIIFFTGLFAARLLSKVYSVWMGIAFAIGWIVSRAILVFLYYLVITPIGFFARLSGKRFIDVEWGMTSKSFWILRQKSKKINYNKMV
ncbi:MAG TPA: SxtJ family membrane protein [Bacteroidota bacterium]|nr:SxtJ family membrane protein [Bacteroidota bacterium]